MFKQWFILHYIWFRCTILAQVIKYKVYNQTSCIIFKFPDFFFSHDFLFTIITELLLCKISYRCMYPIFLVLCICQLKRFCMALCRVCFAICEFLCLIKLYQFYLWLVVCYTWYILVVHVCNFQMFLEKKLFVWPR